MSLTPGELPNLIAVGASCWTAPLGVLERLAVAADDLPAVLASLRGHAEIREVVVLSTCNRVEVYAEAASHEDGLDAVRSFLCRRAGLRSDELLDITYRARDEDAVRHLFSVTAGLASVVIGERQIQAQVKRAAAAAAEAGTCGRHLHALFREALRVGKQTRRSTGISDEASSMVNEGLAAAAAVLGDLDGLNVLIVGAGKVGAMAAKRLQRSGALLLVANRTADPARRLATEVAAEAITWPALPDAVRRADLVVSSTGSPAPIIDRACVAAAARARAPRPLVLLDLAVPRDVDSACGELPNVTLLDVQSVQPRERADACGRAVTAAETMVTAAASAFQKQARHRQVEPTITALRARGDRVRADELRRVAHRLSGLDDRERDTVEAVTRRVVNRLLHEPSVQLKRLAECAHPGGEEYARLTGELFGL